MMMLRCDDNYEISIQCERCFKQFKCPKSGLAFIGKHCFSKIESIDQASNKIYISCGGVICFKNNRLLRAVVSYLERRG